MRIDSSVRAGFTGLIFAALLTVGTWADASEPRARPTVPTPGAEHGHEHGGNASPSVNDKTGEAGKAGKPNVTVYTCPMHPEVVSDKPGRCPKCGMKLVPKEPDDGKK